MKRNFLFSMLLAFGFITMSLTGFTGCLNTNGSRDAAHISETELEQLEGDVDAVVKAYFKENMMYKPLSPIRLLREVSFGDRIRQQNDITI